VFWKAVEGIEMLKPLRMAASRDFEEKKNWGGF
jgi:hypothetical protein